MECAVCRLHDGCGDVVEIFRYRSQEAVCIRVGHKGLLKGRKATCFPGFEDDLEGAILTDELAVTDGKFITGKGAGAAFAFGFSLVEDLADNETAVQVASKMQCR